MGQRMDQVEGQSRRQSYLQVSAAEYTLIQYQCLCNEVWFCELDIRISVKRLAIWVSPHVASLVHEDRPSLLRI